MNTDSSVTAIPEDDGTFVNLLTEHQVVIRSYIYSAIPNSPDADDVIQETNVVLWRKRDTFELGSNFKAWALTVAKFQVMAYRKSKSYEKVVAVDDQFLDVLSGEYGQISPEEINANYKALEKCMNKLSEEDKELIRQRYWHKLPLRDFAIISNRSENAVRTALYRLRLALKQCISREISKVS